MKIGRDRSVTVTGVSKKPSFMDSLLPSHCFLGMFYAGTWKNNNHLFMGLPVILFVQNEKVQSPVAQERKVYSIYMGLNDEIIGIQSEIRNIFCSIIFSNFQ